MEVCAEDRLHYSDSYRDSEGGGEREYNRTPHTTFGINRKYRLEKVTDNLLLVKRTEFRGNPPNF